MRALSVRQPWASLIAHGHKLIENRSWCTSYRGPLLIHAGQSVDREVGDRFEHLVGPTLLLPRGGFVARVQLVEIVTSSASPWFSGPFGWVLEAPERVRCRQGPCFARHFQDNLGGRRII